eukprot:GHVN01034192.1.p1 GENE.GHVN01034192.1~~GHVN01034192.1.p1  ORF type:complete len:207 (+),score=23.93 GHVN01034192.1:181-801(+)
MRVHMENELMNIKKNREDSVSKSAAEARQMVDKILQGYRLIAEEAAKVAEAERAKIGQQRSETQKQAETACRAFENDFKTKTQEALEWFEKSARVAHDAALAERRRIHKHCIHLEKIAHQEREYFNRKIEKEVGARVASYKRTVEETVRRVRHEKLQFREGLSGIQKRVEGECDAFERKLRLSLMIILAEEKGLRVKEKDVQKFLG